MGDIVDPCVYNPGTLVQYLQTTVLTVIDNTNQTLTFPAPTNGKALIMYSCPYSVVGQCLRFRSMWNRHSPTDERGPRYCRACRLDVHARNSKPTRRHMYDMVLPNWPEWYGDSKAHGPVVDYLPRCRVLRGRSR